MSFLYRVGEQKQCFFALPGESGITSMTLQDFWDLQSPVYVEVSMGRFPDPIAASREIHSYTELREQIYRHPRLWRRDVVSQRSLSSAFTSVKKLAAIIVVLGFVVWLAFGVSTYHAPRAGYPYYDTQKPVPPWSEPMPLEGNYDRGAEHK